MDFVGSVEMKKLHAMCRRDRVRQRWQITTLSSRMVFTKCLGFDDINPRPGKRCRWQVSAFARASWRIFAGEEECEKQKNWRGHYQPGNRCYS